MTRIDFYHYADDKLRYACRLAAKAAGRDSRLVVYSPHHDVLLNLADEWPPFFASFERLLEVVGADEEDRQRARARFAFYRKRGYDINVNAIGEA